MASSGFRQDMPPPGGYESIPYKRIPIKSYFNGPMLFGSWVAFTTVGYFLCKAELLQRRKLRVEEFDVNNALEPLLYAERDRMYLKELRQNREKERELMKNVPGWQVGKTVDGEPLYKSLSEDFHVKPAMLEYYAHTNRYNLWYQWMYSYRHN